MLSSGDTSLLSERGSVSIDERTNTVLLKDTVSVIDSVKEMIEVLDIPVSQVVIESRMVSVSDSVVEELGVEWELYESGAVTDLGAGNTRELNINVPDTDNSIGFQLAKFSDNQILDLTLKALETESKVEVIASPRITTSNQQTAYIEQGTEVPYVESSSSGATSISFQKAVLSLEVTPQITPDNKVILDLAITQDSLGESTDAGFAIDTQEITTQVLVDNGETLVLGGIYQQRISSTVSKLPLLGDIPLLGELFKSTDEEVSKDELLIFVTPRIVMQTKY